MKGMTPEQIAPHQVRVRKVRFLGQYQAITGDRWQVYQAPDGEVAEVRVACGAYAPNAETWTGKQARQHAVSGLNLRRKGRAGRMAAGLPVTCQLRPPTNIQARPARRRSR